mmetsp:Transcript_6336/g.22884  ORF Transcript_6336/g.22884 Transcript_6336/m.22884 type:complete len:247 (+) Transcript_6336:871-1611(+)
MHVTRVTATPPNISMILSADGSSRSAFGRESGDAGELARGASADDGDIISVSCLLTSSAVTPCDNLEGDVNTLPAGVLKFVLDVTRGLSSWASSSRLRLDLHGRHGHPTLCLFAPQRETMMYPPSRSPSSSPLALASFCTGDDDPASSSLSHCKNGATLGLARPLLDRELRARVGGCGIPSSHGECSLRLGVTTPRILTACRPLLNSFRKRSSKKRINSCASCCSLPANVGTSVHTLRSKSTGGNA